jgi:hypothetical protein
MVVACDTAEEGHTVLGRPIARTHDLSPASRRRRAIHDRDAASGVLTPVIRDVQPDNRRSASGWGRLLDGDLRDFAVLPEVVVGSQCGDELETRTCQETVRGEQIPTDEPPPWRSVDRDQSRTRRYAVPHGRWLDAYDPVFPTPCVHALVASWHSSSVCG